MKPRRLMSSAAAATALLLGLCVAGCSDDPGDPTSEAEGTVTPLRDDPSNSPESQSSTPETSAPATSSPQDGETSGSALLGACDHIATDDVVDSFGVEIEKDAVGSGSADEQGATWKYETCSWETPDQIEVTLGITTAEGFPDGVLGCPPLAYLGTPGEPVDGLDADAWWVESGFNEEEGTLRVCTDTHLFDIDVDRPSGTVTLDLLREQATDLAVKVLFRLET